MTNTLAYLPRLSVTMIETTLLANDKNSSLFTYNLNNNDKNASLFDSIVNDDD
jgi:hypothetical protein